MATPSFKTYFNEHNMINDKLIIENRSFDEERALYNLCGATVKSCIFAGEADGESALKECRDVKIDGCSFSLRYPLWHAKGYTVESSSMDAFVRAPIWYSENGKIKNCTINSVKCLRECVNTEIDSSDIVSEEFGWLCQGLKICGTKIESQYLFFMSENITASNITMKGKYSFQYTKDVVIKDSRLDTKDAFWHSKNARVENSVVKGEYLGWFSEGLTLINCHISGTQPLCYCKDLTLINCTMENTDLSFEYSDVNADISGYVMSVKNPRSGHITADGIGQIIREDSIMDSTCKITVRTEEKMPITAN